MKEQLCRSSLSVKGSKNKNAHFPALSPIIQIAKVMPHSSKQRVCICRLPWVVFLARLEIIPIICEWEMLLLCSLIPIEKTKVNFSLLLSVKQKLIDSQTVSSP